MTPEEGRELWATVRANSRALDSCAGPHEFVDISPDRPCGKRWRCSLCNGELEGAYYLWYKRGVDHGVAAMQRSQLKAQ